MLAETVNELNDSLRLCCRDIDPGLDIISFVYRFETYFIEHFSHLLSALSSLKDSNWKSIVPELVICWICNAKFGLLTRKLSDFYYNLLELKVNVCNQFKMISAIIV